MIDLFETVLAAARRRGVEDVEVAIHTSEDALTRFANNAIHQNVAERQMLVSIRPVIGQRTARATTNRTDDAGLDAAVEEAIALTRSSEPDPDLLPLYVGQASASAGLQPGRDTSRDSSRVSASAAACTPADRAAAVREAISIIESEGQTAAGIYSTGRELHALFNSRGLARQYSETETTFSVTAMAADSSGWAKLSTAIHEDVRPAEMARRAATKARMSANPAELPPGEYTVVLEPAAVLDLIGQIFPDFSATSLHDQRSFLNERLGTKLFGDNITIYDDVDHPQQTGPRFDGEGVPRQHLTLVDAGVIRDIAFSRISAAREGREPTGHGFALPNEAGEMPSNIVIAGGTGSVDDLIASTERGILVTRLWYIREVEPYEKVMTGMTRDGTFLIEGGRIARGLRNFRFNQSVVELLQNVEALSTSVRASGEESFDMVVPGMKVRGFRFTEVTRF
jgi:predicted Zn-dependent protease